MKDRDIVKLARQIDSHIEAIKDICRKIEDSEHPNAREIKGALWDNEIPPVSWATHAVSEHLLNPDAWETGVFGIQHKAATKAVNTRRANKQSLFRLFCELKETK